MKLDQNIPLFPGKRNAMFNRHETTAKKSEDIAETALDKAERNRKLKEACDGFEEIFVHKLMQQMRNSSTKDGLFSGGRGEEIFQDMLDENYSQIITKSGSLGLSKMIYESTKEN